MRSLFTVVLVFVSIMLTKHIEAEAAEESLGKQYEAKNETFLSNQQALSTSSDSNRSLSMKATVNSLNNEANELKIGLEPRISDHNFVKDIVDRLHALDADIGKLIYNSTSMYAPNDANDIGQDTSKGGEKFTEVLVDLDSLQDEIGVLINNATRSRQYNILVRLRPLNNILYRIRHNLHLMRNSLVAINTVSSLEKIGNSVIDSTLQAFMRPDANLNEELGDSGNYDINLDKLGDVPATTTVSTITTTTTTAPPTTNSTSTTTTTPRSSPSTLRRLASNTTTTAIPAVAPVRVANMTAIELQHQITTRRARPQASSPTRRPNQRNNSQRRSSTQKPSTSSAQPTRATE